MIVFLLAFVFLTVSVLAVAYLAVRFSQLFFWFSKLSIVALSASLAFQEIHLVKKGFLNWLLWFLIFGVVMIVICGFPRINQAIETGAEMIVGLCAAKLVLDIFHHDLDDPLWWTVVVRILIMIYPLPFYFARKHFSLSYVSHVGRSYETHLFSPDVVTDYYQEFQIKKDLTRGILNYGDIWLPFQRVAASVIYGFSYAGAIQLMFLHLNNPRAEDIVAGVLWAVFAVAAFFIDIYLTKRLKATGKETNKEGLLTEYLRDRFSS